MALFTDHAFRVGMKASHNSMIECYLELQFAFASILIRDHLGILEELHFTNKNALRRVTIR
jgi:hypothetical protein